MGCFNSDYCNYYNDVEPYDRATTTVKVKKADMCLCEGRHPIPQATNGAIFGNMLNPLDTEGMEAEALTKLEGMETLNLYVTGLTVALIAVLNAARQTHTNVTLYHYNRETDTYYTQEVK